MARAAASGLPAVGAIGGAVALVALAGFIAPVSAQVAVPTGFVFEQHLFPPFNHQVLGFTFLPDRRTLVICRDGSIQLAALGAMTSDVIAIVPDVEGTPEDGLPESTSTPIGRFALTCTCTTPTRPARTACRYSRRAERCRTPRALSSGTDETTPVVRCPRGPTSAGSRPRRASRRARSSSLFRDRPPRSRASTSSRPVRRPHSDRARCIYLGTHAGLAHQPGRRGR